MPFGHVPPAQRLIASHVCPVPSGLKMVTARWKVRREGRYGNSGYSLWVDWSDVMLAERCSGGHGRIEEGGLRKHVRDSHAPAATRVAQRQRNQSRKHQRAVQSSDLHNLKFMKRIFQSFDLAPAYGKTWTIWKLKFGANSQHTLRCAASSHTQSLSQSRRQTAG